MNAEIETKPTSLESLKKHRVLPGFSIMDCPREQPKWVDQRKLDRAKELYKEHSNSIQFGHLSGLLMIFLYTKDIEPFVFTGQSSNFVLLLRRYVTTARHVRYWYTGDIWDPKDAAHKSLMAVNEIHKKVAIKIKDKYPDKDFLNLVQFNMAMTQFAFMGLTLLFPRRMGITWSDEDTECFLHLWRCIGYLLFMDDRYNICAGNHKETLALFRDILDNEIKPGIKNPHQESVCMARDIITVFSCIIPFLTWQSLCEYWIDALEIPRNYSLKIYDGIGVLWLHFTFGVLMLFRWIRCLLNSLSQKNFNHVLSDMAYYESVVLAYEKKLSSTNIATIKMS